MKLWIDKFLIIFLLFVVILPSAAENKEGDELLDEKDELLEDTGWTFDLKGQFKNIFIYQEKENYYGKNMLTQETKKLYTNISRIRLSPELKYADNLILHIDYDNEMINSNYHKTNEFSAYWRSNQYNDLLDLSYELSYSENVFYRTKFHRAYLKMIISNLTLTAGRQQIRFGSGKLWNPLDILNPVNPTLVEGAEEQKGTDAIRADYYFGETTELSLVYDQKRYENDPQELKYTHSNSLARLKTSFGEHDIAVLGGRVAKRKTFGADFATIILDGILRGSIIYSKPQTEDSFLQAGAGYDYTFENSFSVLAEYFYNENSLNDNDDLKTIYTSNTGMTISQENYYVVANQFITYNKHYAGLALGYDFHPLLRGDVLFICDIQGKGMFVNPLLKLNVSDNIDLSFGALLAKTKEVSEKPSDFREYEKSPLCFVSSENMKNHLSVLFRCNGIFNKAQIIFAGL
jgi:hypothetical protein